MPSDRTVGAILKGIGGAISGGMKGIETGMDWERMKLQNQQAAEKLKMEQDQIAMQKQKHKRVNKILPEKPEEILKSELDFFEKTGIRDNLSMQRSNGLESMIRRMKLEAAKYIKN
jgi:hypothetical protein